MDHLAFLEQRAVEFARRGDFGAEARGINEEITRLAPDNQGAWTRLARCCLEMGLLDDATAALDTVLRINPQNTIARNLHFEVSRRRSGLSEPQPKARTRARAADARTASRRPAAERSSRSGTITLGGIGRAEFTALGHLAPPQAVESLSARLEPLLMALNERPFAERITEARNRAGQAGVRLFRRGSIQVGGPGHIYVFQQGGRWEPEIQINLYAAAQWRRDALSAGIGFRLAPEDGGERAEAGRERLFDYFAGFQQLLSSTWRVLLADWLRANAGFVQLGYEPPSTDLLPADAVAALVNVANPGAHDWIFCGRWLFLDRGEDVGILTDAPRLLRWIEGTFNDLLPLWSDVYRRRR